MRRIWVQRLLFLLFTLSAVTGFEIYNQTIRIYHVVSMKLDLDVPVTIHGYGTNRSTMRRIARMIRTDSRIHTVPADRHDPTPSPSDVALAAATLDRCVESIGQIAGRFSIQSLGIAVVHDSASHTGGIPVHLSHGSTDCGDVVIRSGAVRCIETKNGPLVVTGDRARDLIESD